MQGTEGAERTIPILPCASMDPILAFYGALGFEVTYRQERPNTYAIVVRGGIELQFFVLKGLDPGQSYSTCYVVVPDADAIYDAFTTGLRAATGRVPRRGIPRIGPLRNQSYGVRQFIVVDPAGNSIRIGQPIATKPVDTAKPAGRLERALAAAATLADSKGDDAAAAKVLDSAFADEPPVPGATAVQALVLRADLAYRLQDTGAVRTWLTLARALVPDDIDLATLQDELRRADELEEAVAGR
jgi:hypothetical protein